MDIEFFYNIIISTVKILNFSRFGNRFTNFYNQNFQDSDRKQEFKYSIVVDTPNYAPVDKQSSLYTVIN